MFIAMNRFRVKRGCEDDFETIWKSRDTHLHTVPGFIEFHLLRGPETDDHTLFATHAIWETEQAFTDWTQSAAFRKAHAQAGGTRDFHAGPPQFEGFTVVQEIKKVLA